MVNSQKDTIYTKIQHKELLSEHTSYSHTTRKIIEREGKKWYNHDKGKRAKKGRKK